MNTLIQVLLSLFICFLGLVFYLCWIFISIKLNLFDVNTSKSAETLLNGIVLIIERAVILSALVCIWYKTNATILYRLSAWIIGFSLGLAIQAVFICLIFLVQKNPSLAETYIPSFNLAGGLFGNIATVVTPWQLLKLKRKLPPSPQQGRI